MKLVYLFVVFAFILQLRMVFIICNDYYEKAIRQTVKHVNISTGRADITDCNLKKITGTEDEIKVLITSQTNLQDIYENIRPQDREKFYNRIQNETRMVVNLANPIDSETIYTTTKRYSSSNIAQHLIGYTDSDSNGLTGIEKAFDVKLKDKGEKITLSFNVNGNGDIYGDVHSSISDEAQVLSLTVDNSIQRMCESVAREYISNGSIVIMETATGKIKAMVSMPCYDANNIAASLDEPDSPLLNKALQAYEPGSVIKPLWAAAFLENGIDKEKLYECKGYTDVNGHIYHCANNNAHGMVDMEQALIVSCNCYFIDTMIENKGYIQKQYTNQVNIGRSITLCQNYTTKSGYFPRAEKLKNTGVQSAVSFGQGDFLVSPVHVAAYMNIFANDGIYVYPQIAEGMFLKETGEKTENLYNYQSKRVISQHTAETVKNMLKKVVEKGNGGRANPEYLTAAGKTGTAQTGKTDENGEEIFVSWFCGFYPGNSPEYTICVMLYDGGESSYSTTPLFKKICDNLYYLRYAE
ncbi:MAG: penicillin-binding protein 2 [Oscillospiraceae bacterium]|nr:penicillin-binding protein 2 [Oscillospiraceae bacterium]